MRLSPIIKVGIIGITLVFAFGVIFIGLLKDVMIITPLLFYIPILVAAYWFPKKGIYFAIVIGGINIAVVYVYSYPGALGLTYTTATASFYVLVALTLIITSLSQSLRTREIRYRGIFDHAAAGILIVRPEKDGCMIIEVNNRGMALLGYTAGDFSGKPLSLLNDDLTSSGVLTRITRDGRADNVEISLTKKDGTQIPVIISGARMPDGMIVLNVTDISDRKLAEEELQRSLREKEILLREVHHRVKNNMQVISGLIELQGAQISDTEIRKLFFESQNRIRTMALIHEILYRSNDYARINFSTYLNELITYLLSSYGRTREEIVIDTQLTISHLSLDMAIPCGLIANELISNALKHAFPDGQKGHIAITLTQDAENEYILSVSDNGIGFPLGFEIKNASSFGLQLVNGIATHQMRGTVELTRKPRTAVTIRFPSVPMTPR
ncbi:MAG: nitrate/nitrite sensor protein NarQ [Methanoregula sp. PtaU1.Bin051]|nr:MAG: nitrate/nitrite sensor protein NarQ [Methanoregula sp. PtaU1.Bin051]